jgi:phosphoenolpyruvate carboxykinase (GTP)
MATNNIGQAPTRNARLLAWVEQLVALCKPATVHWCDGSQAEYQALCDLMVRQGTFTQLNPRLRPGCYLARSHPSDVGRVEDRTFICSRSPGGCRADQQLG